MEWMHSSSILILILLCKMLPVSGSCPECPSGSRQEGCKCVCKKDQYLRQKPSGQYKCDDCTEPCSATKHLVEVKACGNSTNRVCHCAKGYYCTEAQNYSCLFACEPCKPGTFSSETSLEPCKAYTNCKGRGVVTEGTSTQDRICATTTTTTTRNAQHTVSYNSPTATVDDATNVGPNTMQESSSVIFTTITNRRATYRTSHSLNTRHVTTDEHFLISNQFENPLVGSHGSHWLAVLLLLLVVSVLVGCCLWLRGKALKKQLKWTRGLPFGKYVTKKETGVYNIYRALPQQQQQQQQQEGNPCLERLTPLGTESGVQMREGGSAAQSHPAQGGRQHVTMDNSGRGENVNNNVGSIFIYSPGMVVLGTNASERREEMRQEGMDRHLSSVPQQESRSTSSSSYPDSVGLSTQEEDEDKELSYPIPASGK